MSMKVYYESPNKNEQALKYFFENIDTFIKYKKEILSTEKFYNYQIPGVGAGGLFIGEIKVGIGQMLELYEKAWKVTHNGNILYLIHMSGSPLSGSNSCTMYDKRTKSFVNYSYERFSTPVKAIQELPKPCFTSIIIPEELSSLFDNIDNYIANDATTSS